MTLFGEMSGKIELVWDEDPRSIGILAQNEEGSSKYKPLIMLNFVLIGYISCGDNPYRGYQILVKTYGGNEFTITVTEREIQRYCHSPTQHQPKPTLVGVTL